MQNIPIDACILDKDSSLLQQACDIHELTSNDWLSLSLSLSFINAEHSHWCMYPGQGFQSVTAGLWYHGRKVPQAPNNDRATPIPTGKSLISSGKGHQCMLPWLEGSQLLIALCLNKFFSNVCAHLSCKGPGSYVFSVYSTSSSWYCA